MEGGTHLVQRFWRALIGLFVLVILYTSLSWYYLYTNHTLLSVPTSKAQLLSISTGIPSIWDFIRPSVSGWTLPLVILIVQVFLTGGFYGILIRANTGQEANPFSFISDAMRSFWRLLLWNVLWTAIALLVIGITRGVPQLGLVFTILVLIVRYLFLFGDIALVCERDIRFAFKSAVSALMNGVVPMIPFALVMMLLSGIAVSLTGATVSGTVWLIAIIYGVATTWVLHMVVARYLFYSEWQSRNRIAASV
jgi:hypothetical protein